MNANTTRMKRCAKVLLVCAAAGATQLSSACSLNDVGKSIIAGSLDFASDYTGEFLAALFPPAEQVVGGDEDEE